MDQSLYRYSLMLALPLILFFGFHMLLARVPEKQIYSKYLRSRRLMGVALLILAANYSVHLLFGIRLKDVGATILFNMSTYFLCYWLFCSGMMTLLDNAYVTRKRFTSHLLMWLAYSAIAAVAALLLGTVARRWVMLSLAIWLLVYGVLLSRRILRTYSKALKMFENTHSDDIGAYISWLSVFTYWAICFGVSCGLLTFLPDAYVFVWILSSIPFYIYLYCCYQNYIFFYEKVENALLEDADIAADGAGEAPAYHSEIGRRIEDWIDTNGYCKPGITLNELAQALCTNRTYLSEYINGVYGMSYRDWISDMRIGYAKRLMTDNPHLKLQKVSEASGFLSISHFSRTFSEKEGCSPAKWRNSKH